MGKGPSGKQVLTGNQHVQIAAATFPLVRLKSQDVNGENSAPKVLLPIQPWIVWFILVISPDKRRLAVFEDPAGTPRFPTQLRLAVFLVDGPVEILTCPAAVLAGRMVSKYRERKWKEGGKARPCSLPPRDDSSCN